jgi:predicted  nucleic acid-binding Zn-ribbon protein
MAIPPSGSNPIQWQNPPPNDGLDQYRQQIKNFADEVMQLRGEFQAGVIDVSTLKSKIQDLIKQNNDLIQKLDSIPSNYDAKKLASNMQDGVQELNETVTNLDSGNLHSIMTNLQDYYLIAMDSL